MSRNTCYIRIGSDKAGTTTIANLVEDNRKVFRDCGVLAPIRNIIALIDHVVKENGLDRIDLFDPGGYFRERPLEGAWLEELIADRRLVSGFDLFLPTETVWGRLDRIDLEKEEVREQVVKLLDALKAFFPEHDVKVLVHLRRIDTYLESAYNQRIKSGGTEEPQDYLLNRRRLLTKGRSPQLYALIAEVFGRDNVIIKPFERAQMYNNDLIDDLLETLGITRCSPLFVRKQSNESLHRALVEVLRDVNEDFGKVLDNKDLRELSGLLRNHTPLRDEKRFFTHAQRLELLERFQPFYDELSAQHWRGKPLFVDPLPGDEGLPYEPEAGAVAFVKRVVIDSALQGVSTDRFLKLRDAHFGSR
jgi:hypothetical protein